jgi:small multidrug resistance pump
MGFWYLAIAIVAEVIGTMTLKASEAFSNVVPSTVCILSYATAFYFFSLVLKTVPVGIAYAIWAGLGIVLVALISAVIYRQVPDLPAIVGMIMIISGVVVINIFSKMTNH